MDSFAGGLCALGSAVIWAFSATLMTAPARVYGGRATNLFKSTVGAAFFLLTVALWLGFDGIDLTSPASYRFIASGILGLAIADTAYLSALRHIGPSLTAIVYQTSGIFTVILGITVLNERLTGLEVAGIALVIGGVLLAVLSSPSTAASSRESLPAASATAIGPAGQPGHRLRGSVLALVAAAFHACGLIMNKSAFDELEASEKIEGLPAAMIAGCVRMTVAAAGLFLFGVLTRSVGRQTRVFREAAGWRSVFLPAFLGTFVAMITMQLSITLLKSGVASVLLSMTPIFTIPVEWWILKQKPRLGSIVGGVIALFGAYLLAKGQ